jgi:outer membrane protein OmpA-like peptidoglycan-associated protein
MKRTDIFSKNFVVTSALIALIGGAAGCSVATPPALIDARNSYQQAEKNPNMTGNAAVALREAEQTLNRGEREWEQNRDQEETEHLAYIAKQRVEIAQRIAERNMAEKEIERLGDERQKVIIEAREREVLRSRKEAEARAQEAEQAQRQAAAAQSQAKIAQDEAAARAREAEQARKTTALTRAEADAARKREQDAAAKSQELQKQLAELQAKMKQTDRGLVLTLGDVLFEFNKAELKAGALRNLYPLVAFLNDNPSRAVAIEGHTDSVGAESYNLELSQRRAEAVRRFLTENGLAQDRITARGLGEAYPVGSNDTGPGRQMNRRVEIIIADEAQALQPGK